MPAPIPSDVKNTSRTVLAALAAGAFVAGFGTSHFGGAVLDAPQPQRVAAATLVIHAIRGDRPDMAGPVTITAYSHSVFTLIDAGVYNRDNNGASCPAGAAITTQYSAIETACAPPGGWLRVVELRAQPDGGATIEAYGSTPLADGGATDNGRVACGIDMNGPAQTFALAKGVSCVETVLDNP